MRRISLAILLFGLPLLAQTPLSTRVVAYRIDARLDAVRKTIDATEVLTYRNLTGTSLKAFPFHLYLNRFQPNSSASREAQLQDADWELEPGELGNITIPDDGISVRDEYGAVISHQFRFIHPDDDDAEDHTVAEITLARPISPNSSVTFQFKFHDQLPEVTARTGYKRDYFLVGQWFPKIGVWWHGAWNCHQFHETTEFFADFGTYDVSITVPRNFITGSSGDEIGVSTNPDGTKTVHYHGEDIHDFAWTASPEFRVVDDNWQGSAGRVHIRLLMQPAHMAQAPRYMSALKGTLEHFDRRIGPYPYDRITVVDPAPGALESGGMEYPTLITADTVWRMPKGILVPEAVVEHEFGHQYWYGMVATNEFEEAWMDEGINTYTEYKFMDSLYGPNSMLDFLGATGSDADSQHPSYARLVRNDPITRKGWKFLTFSSYDAMTYSKTGAALESLESVIGQATLRRALHEYFLRYRFTHPTAEDFFKTVSEVSGRDLTWFWNQAFYGTNVLDYEVLSARSEPVDSDAKAAKENFRTDVVIHRKGDFIFPAEIEMRFDDGQRVRERWDGADRWIRYSYTKNARLVSAEVDPDHRVPLDVDFFNNSRLVEPDNHAARKLANYWMLLVQFFSGLGAWLV